MQTVVCMKWGTRYPSDYVNRLWSMISRNTKRETRLICFTDDSAGVSPQVICRPLPEINIPARVASTPWRKLSLWQMGLSDGQQDFSGDLLFLDLDMVITGSLDDLFEYEPGRYCVIHNWTQPSLQVGNTSLFRFRVGRHCHIFDRFNNDPESVLAQYRIEQQYISGEVADQVFWPAEWCVSFKHNLLPRWPLNFFRVPPLPEEVRTVAFTGKPDPDEAAIGVWPVEAPWKRLYKHVRPTPWIAEHWR
ncbi:MAG: hypothetical protein AAGI12_09500 [Pseudomonadota bacterium]